ncbi:hypothetical protein OIU76_022968 [Salix suchowensis]|nr:hypothetical protein OIU76_022968 [Salix suchowensis]
MEDQSQPSPPPQPPPPLPKQPPSLKTYKFTASSISYVKSTTTSNSIIAPFLLFKHCTTSPPSYILKEVSLTAYPSQILAVVGPSGAGKSTLLDILAARTSPTSGVLLLNSTPIKLFFISQAIATIVESLLGELNLTHLANARLAHGLSGGERRRVSIGLSLLHDPGLDSKSALNVMQTLKSIATSRYRTVILSIHQPSFNILSTIDKILLLNKGTVVHHGTLSSLESFLLSNGFTVPPQLNSLEYAMEILNQLQESKPNTPPSLPPSPDNNSTTPLLLMIIEQEVSETRVQDSMKSVFYIVGTIYINIGYGKQGIEKRFGLFAFTLTFLLSSTTETLPIFINERPILLRETSSGLYRLSSYLIANTLVFLPYLFAIAIIYSVSIYFMVGLCGTWQAFAYFVLVIWVIVLMGNSFVLFLSSLAPNYIAGTSLVTILLGGFFLFSGYFISQDSMPKYWLFMHFFSMYKYALDALLINEYSCLVTKCFLWYQENSTCMVTGGDVLQNRGLHERQRWTNIYVLVGFFVFYRVLCLLVLIRRVSRSKK